MVPQSQSNPLVKCLRQRQRRIIGLMSGTSADGLDLAVVDFTDRPGFRFHLVAAGTKKYPTTLRSRIQQMMDAESCGWEELVRLHYRWAAFAAEKVQQFLKENKIPARSVDALASHGQTLAHYSQTRRFLGGMTRGTFQVGDPAVLAQLTGYLTVGDFRWADLGAGGTGAPLSGYYHFLMLSQIEKNINARLPTPPLAILNIGGMANLSAARIIRGKLVIAAFDTGPGNCLSDTVMRRWGGRALDRDGRLAAKGKVDSQILRQMKRHPYFRHRPPKSCGQEQFGSRFLLRFYPRAPRKPQQLADRLATVDELVAESVADSLRWAGEIGGVIVVGGGRRNRHLKERITHLISPIPLVSADSLGLPGDYLEALGFAILANETLNGRPGNLGGATGARPAVLGKICLPGPRPALMHHGLKQRSVRYNR